MKRELHLAMTEDTAAEVGEILFPAEGERLPERGVIGIVFRSTGRRRTTLLLRHLIQPEPGDVIWDPEEGLLFAPTYKSRALDEASKRPGAGVIFVHTHPGHEGSLRAPRPSLEDLHSDRRDLFFLGQTLAAGAPLAAGIVGENRLWSVREYAFDFPTTGADANAPGYRPEAGRVTYATAVRIVGRRLRKLPTEVQATGPAGAAGELDLLAQDSSILLWGEKGQRILAGLRVGQTGLGGVGGILAEHIARLGVGESVMVDFDRIKHGNRNRSQGATREDADERRLKVEVAARTARMAATAPDFEALPVEGSVVEAETIPDLLDCDVILNAADSAWARQVLDHLAYAHLIPVINGGTELRGSTETGRLIAGKSDVNLSGPGHPCLQCSGTYTLDDVTEAQEHPNVRGHRRYLETDGEDHETERAPSVISNNALVAALIELRLQALALGTTPDAVSGTQRHYVLDGVLHWTPRRACEAGCERPEITALGDSYDLPTGIDLDFQVVREEWEALRAAQRLDAAPTLARGGWRATFIRGWFGSVGS